MRTDSTRDRKTRLQSNEKPLSSWEETVPLGSPWTQVLFPGTGSVTTEPFCGDRVLAQSIALIRDAVVLREFVLATCEGDVGRVYEAMKVNHCFQQWLESSELTQYHPGHVVHFRRLNSYKICHIPSRNDLQPRTREHTRTPTCHPQQSCGQPHWNTGLVSGR